MPGDARQHQQEAHYRFMTQTPIPRLVTRLAVPTIVSMLVSSIYNMADTFFVSQISTAAAGAVGVVFSLMAMIQAIGFTLGMGAGNLVARHLGAREEARATQAAASAFWASIALGALLGGAGLAFCEELMRFLGATETILPYAVAYGDYILYAAPVMCASFVMNNILRGEGKAALAMVGIATGGVLNIGLDPLFIFTFGFGTAGAAMATALSQLISFLLMLGMFLAGKSNVRLSLSAIARTPRVYGQIVRIGLPSFCRQGLASYATMQLNVAAAVYGDAAVAAMSIVARVFNFMFSVLLGLGQGFQPVCGFNYGAARFGRVRSAMLFTSALGGVSMLAVGAACFAFAPQVMALFRAEDALVISIGALAFRAQCCAMPLFAVSTVTNMALQCTGQSLAATLLALCRQGLCFLPLVWFLPGLVGLAGVQLAQPLADLLTFFVSLPFYIRFIAHLRRREAEAAPAPI